MDLQQVPEARLAIPLLVSASAKTTAWLGLDDVLRELCLTSWAALDGLDREQEEGPGREQEDGLDREEDAMS